MTPKSDKYKEKYMCEYASICNKPLLQNYNVSHYDGFSVDDGFYSNGRIIDST